MKIFLIGSLVGICVAGGAPSSFAQTTGSGNRPFRGLFGGGSEGTGRESLDLAATLVQAYDDNLLATGRSVSPRDVPIGGYYTLFSSEGRYAWTGERLQVGLSGTSAWTYYSGGTGQVEAVNHAGAVHLSAPLRRRTHLVIKQAVQYRPPYLVGLFLTDEVDPETGTRVTPPTYAVSDLASYRSNTTATITQNVSRHSRISATADYKFTHFTEENSGRADRKSAGIRTAFSSDVGRHTAISTSYRYQQGNGASALTGSTASETTSDHNVRFGLRHTAVLSATRQAQFAFGVGWSVVEPALDRLGVDVSGRVHRVTGDAEFSYPFGRHWGARAAYRRGLEYLAEVSEPVFADDLRISVDGLLTRRIDLLMAAGYSLGGSVLSSRSSFDTYTANVRSRFALTSQVAAYLEYLYHFYDFGESSLLAPGLSSRLERNSVRAGITLWFRPLER